MKKFQLAALLPALSFTLALPTLAVAGTSQDTQSSPADQLAQSQAEQQRLPAGKEGASSNTAQSPSGPDTSSTTPKKSTVKSKKANQLPPTAVMDRAAPEKSTTDTGTPGKHPATSAMTPATPTDTGTPGKHPATSAMNPATPEKSTTDTGTPGKHPATSAMNLATPEKSTTDTGTPGKHPATTKSADSKGTK